MSTHHFKTHLSNPQAMTEETATKNLRYIENSFEKSFQTSPTFSFWAMPPEKKYLKNLDLKDRLM